MCSNIWEVTVTSAKYRWFSSCLCCIARPTQQGVVFRKRSKVITHGMARIVDAQINRSLKTPLSCSPSIFHSHTAWNNMFPLQAKCQKASPQNHKANYCDWSLSSRYSQSYWNLKTLVRWVVFWISPRKKYICAITCAVCLFLLWLYWLEIPDAWEVMSCSADCSCVWLNSSRMLSATTLPY